LLHADWGHGGGAGWNDDCDLPCSLLLGQVFEDLQPLLRCFPVLACRALELLVVLHIVIVGVDDELSQRARLAARRTTEPCSIGERDRLRLLLIRSLHHQLLGRRLWCASEHCHHNNANNANDFCFHVNLLFLLLQSHHFTSSFWFQAALSANRS